MRWLTRLFAGVLSLLIVLALFALLIAGSEWGLQWAYRNLAPLLPGELTITDLKGRLLGPLHVRGLHYSHRDTQVDLGEMYLDWDPAELTVGVLHIKAFTVSELAVVYPASEKDPDAPITLPDIHLPLTIRIDQSALVNLTFRARDQEQAFEISTASLAAGWNNDRGQIQELHIEMPRYRLKASGAITPQDGYPLDIELQWEADIPEYGLWQAAGRIEGTLEELRLRQQVSSPIKASVDGRLTTPLNALSWVADVSAPDFNLRAIHAAWPDVRVGGNLKSSGHLKDLEAHISGTLRTAQKKLRLRHELDMRYAEDSLRITRLHTELVGGHGTLTVHGSVSKLSNERQLDLNGDWRNLRWPLPLKEPALVESAKGSVTLKGTPQAYGLTSRALIVGQDIPAGDWRIKARGTPEHMRFTEIKAEVLDGSLTAQAEIRWQPGLQWQASVQAKDINPGHHWPDWPGALSLTGTAEGEQRNQKQHMSLNIPQLNGKLLDHNLSASAAAEVHGKDITLSHFELRSDGNAVSASGSVGEQWDARWSIKADNLASLLPDIRGSFRGGGQVSGARTAPLITSALTGTALSYQHYRTEAIQLVMSLDTSGVLPSTLELEAEKLDIDKLHFDIATLRADGTRENHKVSAILRGKPGQMEAEVSGAYLDTEWRGAVTGLKLHHALSGVWNLAAPATLQADKNEAALNTLCLSQDAASVCADGEWNRAQGWQAQARVRRLPLAMAQQFLPPNAHIQGEVDAAAEAQSGIDGIITGRFDVELGDGVITQSLSTREDNIDVAYNNGKATGELDRDRLQIKLNLDLEDGGGISAAVNAKRPALPAPLGSADNTLPEALNGGIKADIRDLSVLPLFVSSVENTQGQIKIDLRLIGNVAQPGLMGEIRLDKGAADIPHLGINIREAVAILKANGREDFTINASMQSGKGSLTLEGNARYTTERGWHTTLAVAGQDVELIHTPEMHIIATPDLRLKIQKNRIDLDGEITIPEANIQPRELSGAVSVSDDVVLLTNQGPPAPESHWLIYSKLRIRLGDFVRFNGFGLRARLAGEIALSDAPQQPTTAKGELRVTEGEYRAYGQELTIERGRLLFFGGAVDNPGLDVRAVRHVDDVTAGLQVRGTLKSPQVSLFSEPTMAETDALSYLLLGRPMSQPTGTEAEQMYGAALGLLGGGFLATKLGHQFGLDDVRLESGGGYGEGALVIRHYLSPKLYVSYGLGLFENLNVFVVRYQMSKLWALQAESGTHSSADILYTLERD